MTTAVVIPAAGTGQRFGATIAKQFIDVHGAPILTWTLRRFRELADAVIVVGSDVHEISRCAALAGVTPIIVPGGETRQQSVAHGLAAVPASCSAVLIHDAVRPCVPRRCIVACRDALREHIAAVVAVRCAATVKCDDGSGMVQRTVDRAPLWLAQTPQGVRRVEALAAFARAAREHWTCTDDAEVMERAGHRVAIIPGDACNLKITTPDDLAVAAALLMSERAADE